MFMLYSINSNNSSLVKENQDGRRSGTKRHRKTYDKYWKQLTGPQDRPSRGMVTEKRKKA
jgi:hypothetical protein